MKQSVTNASERRTNMLDFLKTVFGDRIGVSEYSFPDKTPVYIRDGYKLQQLTWNNNSCVSRYISLFGDVLFLKSLK